LLFLSQILYSSAARKKKKNRKPRRLPEEEKTRSGWSREGAYTKDFFDRLFAFLGGILGLKMCEKKTKSSFSDKFARFEKLMEF
jgi:hypothetical protein